MFKINNSEQIEHARKIIFQMLRERGETQHELAQVVGLKDSMVSRWSSGENNSFASQDNLIAIAKHFKVSVDYLLGFEKGMKNDDDAQEIMDEIRSNWQKRVLFKATKNATPSALNKIIGYAKGVTGDKDGDDRD